jgi:hypothetical protein
MGIKLSSMVSTPTSSDPSEILQTNTISTTDGTQTVGLSVSVESNTTISYITYVTGRSDQGDVLSAILQGGVKNIGGTTVIVGAPLITINKNPNAANWNVTVEVDDVNDTIDFVVSGTTNANIDWNLKITGIRG